MSRGLGDVYKRQIYYDSGHAHGMIATGGEDCVFLAVVMKDENDKGEND